LFEGRQKVIVLIAFHRTTAGKKGADKIPAGFESGTVRAVLPENRFMKKIMLLTVLTFCLFRLNAQKGTVRLNNGLTIAYESIGKPNDPVMILINGTGATMTDWPMTFCQAIADHGLRVIRFDNRDVGLSSKLDSLGEPEWAAIAPYIKTCKPAPIPYGLMDMTDDVIGLMDALKIQKAHIAGASMGGAIAQLLAIHYPARTLTLTSLSASSGNPALPDPDPRAIKAMSTPAPVGASKDSMASYLVGIYRALGSTDDEKTLQKRAYDHLRLPMDQAGINRQVAAILIADHCDRRQALANIKIPVLVIHGDADPLVPLQAGKEVAGAIPGSELFIVKGMGHDLSGQFIPPIVDAMVKQVNKIAVQ
jgi:pimeloyl-ACP methyl ester carboxylesterase